MTHGSELKALVVATEAKSDVEIAIPPATSFIVNLRSDEHIS